MFRVRLRLYCPKLFCCCEPSHWVYKPAHLVPVLSQDKVGGLQQEGHPA